MGDSPAGSDEDDRGGQAARNPSTAFAATELRVTRTTKLKLTSFNKGHEDDQRHTYGGARSATRQIFERAAGDVEKRAGKDLIDAKRRSSAFPANTDLEPKLAGPIARSRKGVEHDPNLDR